MKDYVNFGWRACFAGIIFDLLSLCAVFLVSKGIYGYVTGDRFYLVSGVVLFVVITVAGLLCRNLYTKGLTKRFPDTHVSNTAFLFILYAVALTVAIVLGIIAMLIMVLLMQEMQSGQIVDTYNGMNIYLLYMGASAATYYYFLLYTTASVEYVWRRFLQKNVALLNTEEAKDKVDATDVITAIIEAGESSLDNSNREKRGRFERGKSSYASDDSLTGMTEAAVNKEEVEKATDIESIGGSKASV